MSGKKRFHNSVMRHKRGSTMTSIANKNLSYISPGLYHPTTRFDFPKPNGKHVTRHWQYTMNQKVPVTHGVTP